MLLQARQAAGRASDPKAEPPPGIRPRPFAPAPSGGVSGALSSDEKVPFSTTNPQPTKPTLLALY